MGKTTIIVCCHKNDICKESDIFMPIQVGKAISSVNLKMQPDNEGDNISIKNASYCELTGMYWAWKNLKDVDYIGMCHYRRYFDFNHIGRRFFPSTTVTTDRFDSLNLDISSKVQLCLKRGGCVIAKPKHLHTSLYLQYCEGHYSPDFRILGDVIRETLPPKYLEGFWKFFVKSNLFSPYNMFVMNWEEFDKYCNWLFSILGELEGRIDITCYPPYQKRLFGFIAERLLNLYVKTNRLKYIEIPILKISDEPEYDDVSLGKYLLRTIFRDIAVKSVGRN